MFSISADVLVTVFAIVVLVLLAVVGTILIVVASKKRKASTSVEAYHEVDGFIIAVKQNQNPEKAKDKGFKIESLLQYTNPESDVETVVHNELALSTKNLPESVKRVGMGATPSSGTIVAPRDFAAYRRQIVAEGNPDYKVRELLLERANGDTSEIPVLVDGSLDDAGYLSLKEPVPVKVRLYPEKSSQETVQVFFSSAK